MIIEKIKENKKKIYKIIKIIAFILIIICAGKFIARGELFDENKTENTISFSGHGEVSAVPDIANVSFTITKDAKTVKEAQSEVAQIEKKVLYSLKVNNILDKDIKTVNTSFYPKYEYKQAVCPPIPMGVGRAGITVDSSSPYYCPGDKQIITGYTATESITVKIRNTDTVGKIIEDLGALGVSDLNGPNFAIDNEDNLKDNARKIAIDEAKIKAKKLAKDLEIHLGKVVSFSENGDYPVPIMYGKATMVADNAVESAPAVIPKGENLITSDVTITYEIR